MSGFPILDLVIGMIFVYFLLSIICSSAVEMVISIRKLRAKMLEEWLKKIFDNEITIGNKKVLLGQAIMDHCSVTALSEKGSATSYIDAKNFTTALVEKITYNPDNPLSIAKNIDSIITAIQDTPALSIELKRAFLTYADEAKDAYKNMSAKVVSELQLFRSKIEYWYDSSMERVGGAFKRQYTRYWTFTVGLIVTLLLNADSISIARYLYNNPEARVNLAAQAYDEVKDSSWQKTLARMQTERPSDAASFDSIKNSLTSRAEDIKKVKATLDNAIPLGWSSTVLNDENGFSYWLLLSKIVGLAATILAVMMGAPFWFDLLNKVSNLRGSGTRPASSVATSSPENTNANAKPIVAPVITVTKTEEEAVG